MPEADHAYTVTGRWPFPTDMLRYDGARPATAADRRKIRRLTVGHPSARRSRTPVVSIDLVIPGAGPRRPRTARWESFGWQVPTDVARAAEKAASAREARLATLAEGALAKLTPEEAEAVEHAVLRKHGLA